MNLINSKENAYITQAYDHTQFEIRHIILDWELTTPIEVILDQSFGVEVKISNPSNRVLTNLQASLALPSEFDTMDATTIDIGNLEPEQNKTIEWTLRGINPGYGEITINITSPDIQNISIMRGIIVTSDSLTVETDKDTYMPGDDVIINVTLTNDNPEVSYVDLVVNVTIQGPDITETYSTPIPYIGSLETENITHTWDTAGKTHGTYTVATEVLKDSMVLNQTSTSFILGVVDTTTPSVTNPSATPLNIVADGIQESQLNVAITDESGIASVTVDLSDIGGSLTQEMNNIPGTDVYTVNTTVAVGTAPDMYDLPVNATDIYGNSNTSVNIALTVTEAEDTTPPTIVSATLDAYTTIPDATIHVTVNTTDNVGVTSVTADGASLVETGSIWEGNITALSTTGDYTLTIRAEDAAENFVETTIDYSVVEPTGSLGVGIAPKVTTASTSGTTIDYTVKIRSMQNFDDTVHVYVSMDRLPASYQMPMEWFDWTEQDVRVAANSEISLSLQLAIPPGEPAGRKAFRVKANSNTWITTAYDTGVISIS